MKLEKVAKSLQNSFNSLPQPQKEAPEMLEVLTANERMARAKLKPDPKALFSDIWYEGQTCILFADTGIGKTILAVQIADSISRGEPIAGFEMETAAQKVLYFDFELNDKQFEKRYKNDIDAHVFSDNFYITNINKDGEIPKEFNNDFGAYIIDSIGKQAKSTGAKIVVIDNLTHLNNNTEKAKDAAVLLDKLKSLKRSFGLSLLVLAHTPKIPLFEPISVNHLAGSKQLSNFADTVFSIGKSAVDSELRYIKNLKNRDNKDSNCVKVCRLEKSDFLKFNYLSDAYESEHLKQRNKTGKSEIIAIAKKLKDEGKSLREIAGVIGKSHQTIKRILGADFVEKRTDGSGVVELLKPE